MVPTDTVSASCVKRGSAAPLVNQACPDGLLVKNHAENVGSDSRRCGGNGPIMCQIGRGYVNRGGTVNGLLETDRLKIDNFEIVVIVCGGHDSRVNHVRIIRQQVHLLPVKRGMTGNGLVGYIDMILHGPVRHLL